MTDEQIMAQIRKHEGCRNEVYLDSEGNLTCGIGHLLAVGSKVPKEATEVFFDMDFKAALSDYTALVYQYKLDLNPMRRAVLINMLFNMGLNRVRGFKKMLKALQSEDYSEAAKEMLDSRWARQVKERAHELALIMREG